MDLITHCRVGDGLKKKTFQKADVVCQIYSELTTLHRY